jgi:hypothetical protein
MQLSVEIPEALARKFLTIPKNQRQAFIIQALYRELDSSPTVWSDNLDSREATDESKLQNVTKVEPRALHFYGMWQDKHFDKQQDDSAKENDKIDGYVRQLRRGRQF